MSIDPSILPVIRGLASQIFEAKVIADRLGLDVNFLGKESTSEIYENQETVDPAEIMPVIDKDELIATLIGRVRKLSEAVMLLQLALEQQNTEHGMTDEQQYETERMLAQSLSELTVSMIIGYYNQHYFQECDPSLRRLVAKTLCEEFTRRRVEPLPLWVSYLR